MSDTSPVRVAAAPARDWTSLVELTVLAAIWGASFMLQRVAAPAFGAVALVEVRVLFGALVLLPFVWLARRQLAGRWLRLAVIGLLNSAIPFVLFAWAARHAPAAIGAITNSLAALFAVVVAWAMFGEAIGARRSLGLLAGFAGVVVLVGADQAGLDHGLAALAGTLAALCYGIAGNLVKRWLGGVPPLAGAGATLGISAVALAPLALWQAPTASPPALAWWSALVLGVLCTGAAYALYFRLLARLGPSRAASVTYLVPLFGVAWAWLLLNEPLTLNMGIAAALILAGVALNQMRGRAGGPARPQVAATAAAAPSTH